MKKIIIILLLNFTILSCSSAFFLFDEIHENSYKKEYDENLEYALDYNIHFSSEEELYILSGSHIEDKTDVPPRCINNKPGNLVALNILLLKKYCRFIVAGRNPKNIRLIEMMNSSSYDAELILNFILNYGDIDNDAGLDLYSAKEWIIENYMRCIEYDSDRIGTSIINGKTKIEEVRSHFETVFNQIDSLETEYKIENLISMAKNLKKNDSTLEHNFLKLQTYIENYDPKFTAPADTIYETEIKPLQFNNDDLSASDIIDAYQYNKDSTMLLLTILYLKAYRIVQEYTPSWQYICLPFYNRPQSVVILFLTQNYALRRNFRAGRPYGFKIKRYYDLIASEVFTTNQEIIKLLKEIQESTDLMEKKTNGGLAFIDD